MADMNLEFKQRFIEKYKDLTDIDKFLEYSQKYLRRSIRVNTLKCSIPELKKRLEKNWELKQIPWCKEGFWIKHKTEDRRDIGNLKEHSLGYFYVQESASMLPPVILNPKENSLILDSCACPGSKTTQLAAIVKNTGLIIANDDDFTRLVSINMNLQRCGVLNTIVTNGKAENIKIKFDYILLDAPCSGSGVIRKSPKTTRIWNPNMTKKLSLIQKNLIVNMFNCLEDNGEMTYSTCSIDPEEDEEVIDFLLSKFDNAKIEKIDFEKLGIKTSGAILEHDGKKYNKEVKNCLRIWPQDNDTEGFFVAKIKKL
ncbi:MAG: NOL1/NOP2/sun family putative RNA methylase [Candidatus Nanoarchaeia archaeon]